MPKQIDPQKQRQIIANAAILVINQTGLEGTRLRDVAQAANVTTGAVTHYFDGKTAVLTAALDEIVRRTLARMETPNAPGTPQTITAFIRRVCHYLPLDDEGREEWRVWLAFWGRAIADERLREVHQRHYAKITGKLIAPLRSLSPAPSRPDTAATRQCADAVIAAIDGVGTRATLEPQSWPPQRQKDTLTTLLLPMLNAFAGDEGLSAK